MSLRGAQRRNQPAHSSAATSSLQQRSPGTQVLSEFIDRGDALDRAAAHAAVSQSVGLQDPAIRGTRRRLGSPQTSAHRLLELPNDLSRPHRAALRRGSVSHRVALAAVLHALNERDRTAWPSSTARPTWPAPSAGRPASHPARPSALSAGVSANAHEACPPAARAPRQTAHRGVDPHKPNCRVGMVRAVRRDAAALLAGGALDPRRP